MKRFTFLIFQVTISTCMIMTSCIKQNIPPVVNPTNAIVTTLAGVTGYYGGLDTGASITEPTGVAVDASGNVYVADFFNNLIRKISPLGVVTTLAGSRSGGSANGNGMAASFASPQGVGVDKAGNVYVADNGNNLIRKISPSGVVTTLAGTDNPRGGSNNGVGTAASFNGPTGVAVDSAGNVYVADAGNNLIRKISPSGVVTTLAGNGNLNGGSSDGVGTAASFNTPTGVAVDAKGIVYVADAGNNLIRKISPSGIVTTLAGSGAQGSVNSDLGIYASFNGPTGVAVDKEGNVYVADARNNLIRLITPSVFTLAGNGAVGSANGKGSVASFNNPQGVAVDAAGNVYVADTDNGLIRKISQ